LQIIARKGRSAPSFLAGPSADRQQLGTVLDPAIEKHFFVRLAQGIRSACMDGDRTQCHPNHCDPTGDAARGGQRIEGFPATGAKENVQRQAQSQNDYQSFPVDGK
jgi:hypothetical protein